MTEAPTMCAACIEAWIDEALDQVRQTASALALAAGTADLYEVAEELFESWNLRQLMPDRLHYCAGDSCWCRCREVGKCRT